jgi:CBS domain-containing protein
LLTIGGALGGLLGVVTLAIFPGAEVNLATCALIGMAAMFAGASRALLTSIIFALETTMQPHGLLPLLGACTASYFISFFLMKGSIMTEKIQRRGVFTPDAYQPDILLNTKAEQVMNAEPDVLSMHNTVKDAREWIKDRAAHQGQALFFIVVDDVCALTGIVKREDIFSKAYADETLIKDLPMSNGFVFPSSTLSLAVDILDKHGLDLLPVIKETRVVGAISHKEVFKAYAMRRKEEVARQSISLKREGIKIVLKGRRILNSGE